MNMCISCKHGKTCETSHEWIETLCELDDKWHRPFSAACENYEPDEEDETDER